MMENLSTALAIGTTARRSDARRVREDKQPIFRGGLVPVQQDLAEEVTRLPVVTGYRDYSQDRASKLAYLVATGQAVPFRWTVARCLEDAQYYLVDGRTSSRLLSCYDDDRLASYGLLAQLTHVTVASYQDVVRLVDCYDVNWSSKSLASCLTVAKSNKRQFADISTRWVLWGYGGLAKMLYGFGPRSGAGSLVSSDRAKLLDLYVDYFNWIRRTVNLQKLCFVGLSAAVFSTWRDDPQAAAVFWGLVAGKTSGRLPQPIRALQKVVNQLTDFDRRARQSIEDSMLLCLKALRCWSAYRKDDTVKRLGDTSLEKFSISQYSACYQTAVPSHLRKSA